MFSNVRNLGYSTYLAYSIGDLSFKAGRLFYLIGHLVKTIFSSPMVVNYAIKLLRVDVAKMTSVILA